MRKLLRIRTVWLVFFALNLSACVTAVTPPRSLFEPPPTNFFVTPAETATKTTTGSKGGGTEILGSATPAAPKALDPYIGYREAISAASADNASPQTREALLREGMSMIEFRCGLYFDALGKAVQELSFSRKETSLVGGLTQTAMGLANQSAKSVANTGALFGFMTSTMDAYQEAFLYTPEIDTMRRLVLAALGASAERIIKTARTVELTYGETVSLLKQYESNCQPASIRSLVNQAINKAVPSVPIDQSVSIGLSALSIAFGKGSITPDQAFYLYWTQSEKFSEKDAQHISEKLAGIDSAFTNSKLDPSKVKAMLPPYLKLFSAATIDMWNARIESERAGIAKNDAAGKPVQGQPQPSPQPQNPPQPQQSQPPVVDKDKKGAGAAWEFIPDTRSPASSEPVPRSNSTMKENVIIGPVATPAVDPSRAIRVD